MNAKIIKASNKTTLYVSFGLTMEQIRIAAALEQSPLAIRVENPETHRKETVFAIVPTTCPDAPASISKIGMTFPFVGEGNRRPVIAIDLDKKLGKVEQFELSQKLQHISTIETNVLAAVQGVEATVANLVIEDLVVETPEVAQQAPATTPAEAE